MIMSRLLLAYILQLSHNKKDRNYFVAGLAFLGAFASSISARS